MTDEIKTKIINGKKIGRIGGDWFVMDGDEFVLDEAGMMIHVSPETGVPIEEKMRGPVETVEIREPGYIILAESAQSRAREIAHDIAQDVVNRLRLREPKREDMSDSQARARMYEGAKQRYLGEGKTEEVAARMAAIYAGLPEEAGVDVPVEVTESKRGMFAAAVRRFLESGMSRADAEQAAAVYCGITLANDPAERWRRWVDKANS